ncbi:hypothetical protein PGB90_010141 [Kerria lacca]
MNYSQSPFSHLVHSNPTEDSDSPKSLLDFINAHKSNPEDTKDDIKSLSELTSSHLHLNDTTQAESNCLTFPFKCNFISTAVNTCIDKNSSVEDGSNDFQTLEDYTKSFLNSKGCTVSLCRKSCLPQITASKILKDENRSTRNIMKQITSCNIPDLVKQKNKKMNVTVMPQNQIDINNFSAQLQSIKFNKESILIHPEKECCTDLSSMIEENVLYNNGKLSSFGYVISKKWNYIVLPKKYRKLGKIRPYNIVKSFQFNSLSPDDIALRSQKEGNCGC